jgi:hypothetical protein
MGSGRALTFFAASSAKCIHSVSDFYLSLRVLSASMEESNQEDGERLHLVGALFVRVLVFLSPPEPAYCFILAFTVIGCDDHLYVLGSSDSSSLRQ